MFLWHLQENPSQPFLLSSVLLCWRRSWGSPFLCPYLENSWGKGPGSLSVQRICSWLCCWKLGWVHWRKAKAAQCCEQCRWLKASDLVPNLVFSLSCPPLGFSVNREKWEIIQDKTEKAQVKIRLMPNKVFLHIPKVFVLSPKYTYAGVQLSKQTSCSSPRHALQRQWLAAYRLAAYRLTLTGKLRRPFKSTAPRPRAAPKRGSPAALQSCSWCSILLANMNSPSWR